MYPLDPPRLLHIFQGHTKPINSIAFAEDCTLLASGADDGHILIWSLEHGKLLNNLSPKEGPVTVIRWFCDGQHPDARFIVTGTASGTVQLWKRETAREQFHLSGQFTASANDIEDIAVEETTKLLAIVSRGRISILKLDTRAAYPFQRMVSEPPSSLPPMKALARKVHFYNSGKLLMVAFLDTKELVTWQVCPWKEIWRWRLNTRIGDTAWSPDKNLLLIWNLIDGIDIYHVGEHPIWVRKLVVKVKRNVVKQIEFGKHSQLAISGSDSGEVFLWDIETGKQVLVLIHGSESDLIQTITHHSPQDKRYYVASATSSLGDGMQSVKVWALHPVDPETSRARPGGWLLYVSIISIIAMCLSIIVYTFIQ
ncbi:WD40-repeat-containing domain protein [Hygrophoropsis aurantiaca]|uniref:WD40-repeat-containing domain protein n=1 Tax=Hygrophoropsis aurantiaca TaxID=72124 RepID=A0ACB8A3S4_9AGAM|nr:WD40-repeat-containing domain protein [Hygrophoropsis aurantiaca]